MNINLPYIKMMREKKACQCRIWLNCSDSNLPLRISIMKRVRENLGRTCYRS